MVKALYLIKNLGIGKSTLYLILYPFRFLRDIVKKLDDLHDEIRWQKKISGYVKLTGLHRQTQKNPDVYSEAKEYFKQYGFDLNTDWIHFYEHLSGIKSKYYIPEDLYYRQIEPHLINTRLLRFYGDKNMYDLFFDDINKPQTFLRYFDDTFYSPDYTPLQLSPAADQLSGISKPWLIKPSVETGNGRNIHRGRSQNGKLIVDGVITSLTKLAEFYPSGFIIQERITRQNRTLEQFHPESLNTFRIMTLRLNNQIHTINNQLKFGIHSNVADNGGVWCGLNDNGLLHPFGMNTSYKKIYSHPDTGQKFEGTQIEDFVRISDFAKTLHKRVVRTDLVSWDIGFSETNEPIFIECNTRYQGITAHQVVNGPLFGDLTDEVMAEVAKRRNRNRS